MLLVAGKELDSSPLSFRWTSLRQYGVDSGGALARRAIGSRYDHLATKPLRELVDAHREEIKTIVARHHGRSVAVFGSVARGDERPDSDIDFLVELEPRPTY